MMVRYYCKDEAKMMNEFLSIKDVTDSTADGLFQQIEETLQEYNLKWSDMIAYAR